MRRWADFAILRHCLPIDEPYTFQYLIFAVGIVNISEENSREAAHLEHLSAADQRAGLSRDAHWHVAKLHPNLDHSAICRLFIRAEQNGGLFCHN